MMADSLSHTTASEWDRCYKLELSHINKNQYAKNITFKTLRSLMIEDSRIVPGYIADTVCIINSQCIIIYVINPIGLKSVHGNITYSNMMSMISRPYLEPSLVTLRTTSPFKYRSM